MHPHLNPLPREGEADVLAPVRDNRGKLSVGHFGIRICAFCPGLKSKVFLNEAHADFHIYASGNDSLRE